MATHPDSTRNAATDAVVDLIDGGTTNAQGRVRVRAADDTLLVEHNMNDPAFGAAATGKATANSISDAAGQADMVHDKYEVVDKDENVVMQGSTGIEKDIAGVDTGANSFTLGGDVAAKFAAGQSFEVTGSTGNNGTYTVAAGGASYDSGANETTIPVDESVSDATADGTIKSGELRYKRKDIVNGETAQITSFEYTALRQ